MSSKMNAIPPHIQVAQQQLSEALQRVEGRPVDLVATPWDEIEKSVVKLLGGPFRIERPEHQMAALGLAGAFGERLMREERAFWFLNRDSIEGANLGFEDALIMIAPFGAVADSLRQSKLPRLGEIEADIRRSLAQVRFQIQPGQGPVKLGPEDYQRLFDPGFLQFVVLDEARAKKTWDSKPGELVREVRDALNRTQPPLPPEAKQQFEGQILVALQRMDPDKTLGEQVEAAPRIAELMAHLFATVGGTGSAPEEFWQQLILPLLFIGAPTTFPPVDDEEREAFKQGVDALSLFVEVVPYTRSAPEEGFLGAFEIKDVQLPHPSFERVQGPRLIQIDRAKVTAMLADFDPKATREAIARFTSYMEGQSGGPGKENPIGAQMLDAAMDLLSDLKRSLETGTGLLCLRRLTEAEAASEPAVAVVRAALQGPRIILA